MKKYWQLLNMFLARYLTYRVRLAIWFIADSAQYALFPFLWLTIFATTTPPGGYSVQSLVTYYIVMAVVSTGFISHASRHIRDQIYNGTLNHCLALPFPYFNIILMAEISYKCISGIISAVTVTLLYIFARHYLTLPHSTAQWLLFLASIVLAFLISHFLQFIIGLGTFWLGDIKALTTLEETVNAIFAGRLAPLIFLPQILQSVANYLPFKYLAFTPAQIFVGQLGVQQAIHTLLGGMLWIAGLAGVSFVLWRRGLRRYEGFGM